MEVPDKIYVTECMLFATNPEITLPKNGKVEYTRTDAFIEKVVNFLEILGYAYTITDNITESLYDNTQLIEDFKSYMEE